jgi:hypothetical protein
MPLIEPASTNPMFLLRNIPWHLLLEKVGIKSYLLVSYFETSCVVIDNFNFGFKSGTYLEKVLACSEIAGFIEHISKWQECIYKDDFFVIEITLVWVSYAVPDITIFVSSFLNTYDDFLHPGIHHKFHNVGAENIFKIILVVTF